MNYGSTGSALTGFEISIVFASSTIRETSSTIGRTFSSFILISSFSTTGYFIS
jgi:hypothetical protein